MARAADKGREDDWGRALVLAEQAVRLNPLHQEALYNRALALRQLGLDERAAWATEAFLLLETDAAWRDEALRLRQSLAAPAADPQAPLTKYRRAVSARPFESAMAFVTTDRQRAREFFEDSLLALAPLASSDGDAIERWEDQTVAFARALSAEGDKLPVETARIHTDARGRSRELIDIANHYWTLGRQQYANYEMANMAASFGRAAEHYASAGSPMAFWARHYVVVAARGASH